jgi:hypothetical protein
MSNLTNPRLTVVLLFLTLILVLSGCARATRSVELLPPATRAALTEVDIANAANSEPIALPEVTQTAAPTLLATLVITQTATSTSTPTQTPTRMPTATATPTRVPTAVQAAVPTPQTAVRSIQHVVIISVDGLRPDALEVANTPTLDRLRAAGAYSSRAQAVVPSVTLVNHASMLGGMSPQKHGVTWNIHDPSLGKVNGPTLFSVAQQAGLSTAMVVGKPKLEHLVLPNSVNIYNYAGFTDRQVVNQALTVINAGLPDILFIHLPDVDTAGHATGWMSPGQLLAIQLTDSLIAEIVDALESGDQLSTTLLIVTSDHGGSGQAHGTGSAEDTIIPWLAVGPGVPAGVGIERSIVVYDTAATALQALGLPIPVEWDGRPISEILN